MISVIIGTERDDTKSCVFHGFLCMCSVDRNDTFVKLSDQNFSKIKDSSAKRQDGLQLNLEPVQSKLYSHNGCYLHYTSSYHIAKYLKQNPPTQKFVIVQEPVAKQRRSTLLPFNFEANCLFREEMCSLRPDPCNPSRCILCRTAHRSRGN